MSPFYVAGFDDNVERNFALSTMSQQIERVQFVATLSQGRNFEMSETGNIVFLATMSPVSVFGDIVADVDGALSEVSGLLSVVFM